MNFYKKIISKLTFLRFLCSSTAPIYIKPNHSHLIGSQTLAFFDEPRTRPIIMELFYPVSSSPTPKVQNPLGSSLWKRIPEARNAAPIDIKWPIIFFSHGHGGSRIESAWLFYELVRQGYMVATIDHFGDTWDLKEEEESWRRWHRAQDISFAIRALLKHPKFGNVIDEHNIGFTGFSLGGLTGLWLIGGKAELIEQTLKNEPNILEHTDLALAKKSYYEPLIKAAFLMAPAYARAFDPKSLESISTPTYLIIGENDSLVPKENAEYLNKWIPGCELKILPGNVGHYVFLNLPTRLGKIILPHDIMLVQAASNIPKIHHETAKAAIHFFDQHLKALK